MIAQDSSIVALTETISGKYVVIFAYDTLALCISTVLQENIVAVVVVYVAQVVQTNVPQVVSESCVLTTANALKKNLVVKVHTNVLQVVLESRVFTTTTVRQEKLVVNVLANVP